MTDEVKTTEEAPKEEVRVPVHKYVNVTNNGDTVFIREFPFEKDSNAMKSVRQAIRDLGEKVSIRDAQVIKIDGDGPNGWTQFMTIAFTDLVITEKPKKKATAGTSNARKSAEDTSHTETDAEILGICKDDSITLEERHTALMAYDRHQLIHAFNHDKEGDAKLSHYSTKAATVEALLALATVE